LIVEGGKFRPDIEGLRAISVLSVLAYHYGVPWLGGGFTGVDVFFVISGYLITTILVDDIGQGKFSPLGFYDRRVRRILPAMLVVTAATLLAGYFILLPSDYELAARQAVYSLAGAANIYFWLNTGYFDRQADLLPSLHMWSLAVEEQFYIVWPPLLYLITRLVPLQFWRVAVVAALIVASFIASVLIVKVDPKTAFFLPHTRACELGLGAIIAFLPRFSGRYLSEGMAVIGLGLIAIGVTRLNNHTPFPGAAALLPCVGAALLIYPKAATTSAAMLSIGPMQWFGARSYSLYLWHWPVLVLFRHYINGESPSPPEAAALAVVSVAFAWLSFEFIEQPLRRRRIGRAATVLAGLGCAALVGFASLTIVRSEGFASRIPEKDRNLRNLSVTWEWPCPESVSIAARSYCSFGPKWETAQRKGFLWGDSHAEHFAPLVESADKERSYVLFRECPAILGADVQRWQPWLPSYAPDCALTRRTAIAYLKKHPEIEIVAFAGRWSTILPFLYRGTIDATRSEAGDLSKENGANLLYQELLKLTAELASPGRRFVVFGDIPQWQAEDPMSCYVGSEMSLLRRPCPADRLMITAKQFQDYHSAAYGALARLKEGGVTVILPGEALCKGEKCATKLDGEFLYRDIDHIRRNLPDRVKGDLVKLFGMDAAFKY
jgi:peptidoglycan/LPS O-acetylase OafA/YrhL